MRPSQQIEDVLSKEEIYKLQNSLLEAREHQLKQLPLSYKNELMRLSEIIQNKLGEKQHEESFSRLIREAEEQQVE